ncbi:MAG: hypothetical protein GX962_17130 [Epulopiscium sp.]|nr:hypothetical protein [Candidatus Epulonipiscium sp.]
MKILDKTYKETGTGKEYYFHAVYFNTRLKEFPKENDRLKSEVIETLGKECYVSPDTIISHTAYNSEKKYRNPLDIDTIKKFGKFLSNNEYAFLVPCKIENGLDFIQKDVEEIYEMFYELISIYDVSERFNHLPNKTKDEENIIIYYRKLVDDVEKEINIKYLFLPDEIKDILLKILKETRIFMSSYSVPGVVDSWMEINPKIKYFDPVFDIIESAPDVYNRIKIGQSFVKFRFIPTEDDIEQRKLYFEKINEENELFRYSEARMFQNELLKTLTAVFKSRLCK